MPDQSPQILDFSDATWRNEPAHVAEALLAEPVQAVRIDLTELARPSTLHIQVLLSGMKTYRQRGIDFGLVNPPEGFRRAVEVLGLAGQFEWKEA